MLVGFYRMLAGVLNAVRIQPEPGAPGWPGATAPGWPEKTAEEGTP